MECYKKIVLNIFKKEKYVLHYKNLQIYLRLGLKPKQAHDVLEFNQWKWLKPCIELNTQKRIEAEKKNGGKDKKTFYKSMNNAVYGKTMELWRQRIDVRPVNNEKDYLKWTSKPGFITQKIFDNNLVVIHKIKTLLPISKPAYFEMCILELRNKVLMHEFSYEYM